MDVHFSKHQGLGNSHRITADNYQDIIIKIGISKLPEALLKGHQFYSKHIDEYSTSYSIAETIDDYLADLNAYVEQLPDKKQDKIFEEDKGYSGYKSTGSHYENTKDLSTSQISRLIKKELEIVFEGVAKFSVTTDVFSGGSSINVDIVDLTFSPYTAHFLKHLESGKSVAEYNEENHDQYNRYSNRFNEEFNALVKKVEVITNKYNFDDSDSQTDYFHVRYYEHVKFDEDRYLVKHYPNSPEAKRRIEWDESIKASKAKSKARADADKGKFKKGTVIFYKAQMHKSWHKYLLPNGMYLAKIVKSPNGRARISSYSIRIYQDIAVMRSDNVEYLKKRGYDEYFITNEYGTFYEGSQTISAYEQNMVALDDPAARDTVPQETHTAPTPVKRSKPGKESGLIVAPAIEAEEIKVGREPGHIQVKAYEQVTKQNYFTRKFDTSTWPEYLKYGHDFMTGETDGFKNIDLAKDDPEILAAIEIYLVQLNAYLSSLADGKSKTKADGKPVREISLALKLIKRFANLNGKTLTEKQLAAFIKPMQKAMATQQIRATDPHRDTIYHIQDILVDTFNNAEPDDRIQFTIKGADKYKAIATSETEMLSVKFIKRYVGLIGKTDKTKQRRLHADITNAIATGKISDTDPLIAALKQALFSLQDAFTGSGKLIVSDAELSGLNGLGFIPAMIAAAVGRGIEHLTHKALKPSAPVSGLGCGCQDHKPGLQGVDPKQQALKVIDQADEAIQSVGEAKQLKFDLIGLDGDYLKLIGKACRPTSFFIYGPGGSGKSTFTLLFSNYMAQKGNRVLYVAGEQKDTPVFTDMLDRLKIQDTENFGIVKRVGNHDLNKYDIIAIDSKDSINYSLEDFIQQREKYPHLSFVILSQATKNGGFTGTEKWRNEVDTLILCENLKAYTSRDKNRWGGSSEINILKLIKK